MDLIYFGFLYLEERIVDKRKIEKLVGMWQGYIQKQEAINEAVNILCGDSSDNNIGERLRIGY